MSVNALESYAVLFYGAGYNELEPEIYGALQKLIESIPSNVTLLAQVARAPIQLLRQLRPQCEQTTKNNYWHGTRRFVFCNSSMLEETELNNTNMADPEQLREFLIWGLTSYPAKRVIIILSGHGAGFIGLLTDYQRNCRLIMSINGLAKAINQACQSVNQKIDLLVIDACYMHMVEVLFEITQYNAKNIRYILSPLGDLRLEGIPNSELLRHLCLSTCPLLNFRQRLMMAVEQINNTHSDNTALLLVEPNSKRLRLLKDCIHYLARYDNLLPGNKNNHQSTFPLSEILLTPGPYSKNNLRVKQTAKKALNRICLLPRFVDICNMTNKGPSLYAPSNDYEYHLYKSQYESLAFARHNDWLKKLEGSKLPLPIEIPISSIVQILLDQAQLSHDQAWRTVKNLGWLQAHTYNRLPYLLRNYIENPQNTTVNTPTRGLLLK